MPDEQEYPWITQENLDALHVAFSRAPSWHRIYDASLAGYPHVEEWWKENDLVAARVLLPLNFTLPEASWLAARACENLLRWELDAEQHFYVYLEALKKIN